MTRVSKLKTQIGFSTVELLITIGVLAVLSGVSVFGVFAVKSSQNFKLDAQMIAEAMRFTQSKAQLGDGGIPWGIRFTNNAGGNQTIEIFSGSSYSASSTVETHQLSNTNIFTNPAPGFSETILFEAVRGIPLGAQSIAIKKKSGAGDIYIISLNSMGKISIQLETNMIGYWLFDEGSGSTAYDASQNGMNGGIESGQDPWQIYGKSGGSIKFSDPGKDLIKLPLEGVELGDANWTVSAWVKLDEGGGAAILSNYEGKNLLNEFGIDGSAMTYSYNDGSSWYTITGSIDVIREWRFLTWVNDFDNQVMNMYVDGVLDTSGQVFPFNARAQVNAIGMAFFKGSNVQIECDDLRIYTKAFSADEVKNLYEQY